MAVLEFALNSCLVYFYSLTGSYGFSLILLSLTVSFCLIPFYHLTGILERKERIINLRLKPFIQKINSIKDPKIRHIQLKELYTAFSYYPFYSLRSLAGLFVQIPMLFAAYAVLTKNPLAGESFFFINDLGKADSLLIGMNLLPIIMTLINIASVFVSTEWGSKERRQGIFIAMIFFVLLYNQNAALLIYWTFNQLFNFIRYLKVCPLPKIAWPSFLNFSFAWQFTLALALHCVLTSFVRAENSLYTYGVFAALAAVLIYKFVAKAKIPFTKPNLKTLALNISAMAFPAVLIFKSNAVYFDLADTIIYVFFLLLFTVAAFFLFSPLFSVSFILTIMFLPMVREITHYTTALREAFAALFVVFLTFASLTPKQRRGGGALLTFFLIASSYLLFFVGDVNLLKSRDLPEKMKIPSELTELELKDSASIYLFMHDGFPHKDYAHYFNMPSYDDLMNVFEQNDFKIYDIYSMADGTIETMASVFDFNTDSLPSINNVKTSCNKNYMNVLSEAGFTGVRPIGNLDSFREKMAGNNLTNLLLQHNGYRTGIYNSWDRYVSNGDSFYDFVGFDEITSMHFFEPKNLIFKNLLKGALNSNMQSSSRSYLVKLAEFAQDNSEKSKIFAYGMGCPGHSTLGGMGSTEREFQKFIPIYNKCMAAMKEQIKMATSNKNAIIIFMSDHGVYLMDDGYKFTKNYDFNKTDYIKFRDVFGAFMTIRWPDKEKAAKYDKDFHVSQDLFPIVFAYLFDSEIPLQYKIQNTELRIGPHKFDKGVFYRSFYEN